MRYELKILNAVEENGKIDLISENLSEIIRKWLGEEAFDELIEML